MKNKIYLIVSIVLMLVLTSCSAENSAKSISVEETEKHFYKYVEDIKDCLEKNNINNIEINNNDLDFHSDKINFDYSFEGDSGHISFYYDKDYKLYINLYNDRDNPFGEDYELGIEKYHISYQRDFKNSEDILNTENPSFKILAVVLSNITGETISEEEIKTYLFEIKEDIKIPNFDNKEPQEDLVCIDNVFKNQRVDYYLDYSPVAYGTFTESIEFGHGGNGYTNQKV